MDCIESSSVKAVGWIFFYPKRNKSRDIRVQRAYKSAEIEVRPQVVPNSACEAGMGSQSPSICTSCFFNPSFGHNYDDINLEVMEKIKMSVLIK